MQCLEKKKTHRIRIRYSYFLSAGKKKDHDHPEKYRNPESDNFHDISICYFYNLASLPAQARGRLAKLNFMH
jgi:hypothetical protein